MLGTTSINESGRRWLAAFVGLVMAVTLFAPAAAITPTLDDLTLVNVIVREAEGATGAEGFVSSVGGEVTSEIGIINGFVAEVPNGALDQLANLPSVVSVTENTKIELNAAGWETRDQESSTLQEVTAVNNAADAWNNGHTGAGVTVAVIDTGVTPVEGLATPGKIVNGPDLSFDSQVASMRHLDAYGHGTHMASIIAGRASDAPATVDGNTSNKHFVGIAPDAQILNMKVGASDGAVDVSQVLAAINWLVEHRTDAGMNVRVLSLSFGTDSAQAYTIDPLAYAVEVAWNHGITVVVSGGNDGNANPLRDPAYDPFVIAVGAVADQGSTRLGDDVVPEFSNCGTAERSIDVIASGKSVAALNVPGSYADAHHPAAVMGDFIKGSGSSQAAAVVAGVAALVLDANPHYTPDQVKAAIMGSARPISGASALCQGSGHVDALGATQATVGAATQNHTASKGTGSLQAARGSSYLTIDGVRLEGEIDIHGEMFSSRKWARAASDGNSWTGGVWNNVQWAGVAWETNEWGSVTWGSVTWAGVAWGGIEWASLQWAGLHWNGIEWAGIEWASVGWGGLLWGSVQWQGLTWDHGKRIR